MAEPKSAPESIKGPSQADEDSFKSEFLSEESSDFETLRRTVADRSIQARDPRKRPLSAVPTPVPVSPAAAGSAKGPALRPVPWGWLVLIVAAVVGAPAYILYQNRPSQITGSEQSIGGGVATIDSSPAGATVFIDGVTRGVTPLRLALPAGVYAVELRTASATKTISMRVNSGESLRESVELAPALTVGRLEITSEPSGARVMIDGVAAGSTPLSVSDAAVGPHRIVVTSNGATVARTVVVTPGTTSSVLLSPVPAAVPSGVSGGWVTIQAPFEMQVLEGGMVVGTSDAPRIMLPTGRHELEFRSTRYGFQTSAAVDVAVGRSVTVPVSVPNGRLSINAVPWAEVWLDGRALGETPVANISVPIGTHQLLWRHPQLGERRDSVDVTVEAPARIGIDMPTGRLIGR